MDWNWSSSDTVHRGIIHGYSYCKWRWTAKHNVYGRPRVQSGKKIKNKNTLNGYDDLDADRPHAFQTDSVSMPAHIEMFSLTLAAKIVWRHSNERDSHLVCVVFFSVWDFSYQEKHTHESETEAEGDRGRVASKHTIYCLFSEQVDFEWFFFFSFFVFQFYLDYVSTELFISVVLCVVRFLCICFFLFFDCCSCCCVWVSLVFRKL